MIDVVASAVIAFIEKEIIKHEPEIQAMLVSQLSKLSDAIIAYINGKMTEEVQTFLAHEADEENKES
jgi:hypothetical protein